MKSLDELKKMAQEGKISEKLLKDEDFKEKFKKTLKEENGVEITDEQFTEIIKDVENNLKDEKLLEDIELTNVSGGKKSPDLTLKDKIAFSAMLAAPVVGAIAGGVAGGTLAYSALDDDDKEALLREGQNSKTRYYETWDSKNGFSHGCVREHGPQPITDGIALAATAGVVLGGAAGGGISALIYNVLD
ncbi:MAG: hypothetical protein IKE05_05280 [Clostridia bacterium]|nr:hypothetical protein [Clostridia bacterium]